MENTLTLEPVRWQDEPSRIMICGVDHPDVFFQVTTKKDIEGLCCRRPAEELPRITPLIGEAHHLAAARALDCLFGVEPPTVALNMRSGLLQAQYLSSHLRRLYFLLTHWINPFTDYRKAACSLHSEYAIHDMLSEIMHHLALVQEAKTVLGGRADHPLTAVSGGTSRSPAKANIDRLEEIAEACLKFAPRLAKFMRDQIFTQVEVRNPLYAMKTAPVAMLTLTDTLETMVVTDGTDQEADRFQVARAFHKIAFHNESWTHMSFCYLKDKGWAGLEENPSNGLFFVGPLARLNSRGALTTPLAEQERLNLVETLGPFPHFSALAAYWALLVELVQVSEQMKDLYVADNFSGSETRTPATGIKSSGCAAIEAPEGLIVHQYEVSERGVVQKARIMDVARANNAFKCLMARGVVSAAWQRKEGPAAIREMVAVALLPF